jgi:hypothetical protein
MSLTMRYTLDYADAYKPKRLYIYIYVRRVMTQQAFCLGRPERFDNTVNRCGKYCLYKKQFPAILHQLYTGSPTCQQTGQQENID